MKHFFLSMMAAVALLAAGNLSAMHEGWSAGVVGGLNILSDSDVSHSTLGPKGTIDHDLGYMVGGFAGYGWGNGFSLEGEVSYRSNDFDSLSGLGPLGPDSITGDVSALALMVNAFFHFDVDWMVMPYVGAGIGAAHIDMSGTVPTGDLMGASFSDTDWVFAYQFMGGFEYPVDDAWSLFIEYRYFGTTDGDYTTTGTAGTLSSEYQAHSVDVGAVLNF